MFTITDYARYYKNVSLEESKMNESDILVMTVFSYMPIDPFKGSISFDEMIEKVEAIDYSKPLWLMAPKVAEMAGILKGSLRYKDMVISDFVHVISEETQFGAVTYTFDGNKIIAYEGSDGSAAGWFENFRVAYVYPTITQSLAIDYAKAHVSAKDESIYFAGHSKGGNLAIASAMNIKYQENIKLVYNFDGPGFQPEQICAPEFLRIMSRIINIIPEGSYLGCLLHNNGIYHVVKSNEKGVYIHYPTSWEVFGGILVKESEMSDVSKYLHALTTRGFDSLDHEAAKEVMEATFKALELDYSAHFEIGFRGFIKALGGIHKTDTGVRRFISKTAWILLLATKGKKLSLEELEKY